jgi:TetR/AcrR family transcriptional regulator, cholesterol catabolism regulator
MDIKERILGRAAELFAGSGIKAITMDDLSREAGVSKRTIYENFKDKDQLLRSCLVYMDEFYDREKNILVGASKNTIDMLFKILRHGINVINTINPLFFADLKRYHFSIWRETYKLNNERHLSQTYTVLKQGIGEGLFRDNIDIEIVAKLLHEQLRIMTDEKIFPSASYSIKVVFENIMINFMRGIATRKGMELIENYTGEQQKINI